MRVAALVPGAVLRARSVTTAPGGKPVNVARAARALGGQPTLLANCPGADGARLLEQLTATGLAVVAVRTSGALRTATIVLEDDGRTTVVNEPGPALDDAGRVALLDAYAAALADERPVVVVASGSLPPAAPADLYAEVVRMASERGADTVVDAGGTVLAAALQAAPALVSPNLAEAEAVLRALAGTSAPAGSWPAGGADPVEKVDDTGHDVAARCAAAAEGLVAAGARAALVSGGRAGAALHTGDGSWWFTAPRVTVVNPVGAGDALVAGVAVALARGESLPAAVRFGVASAADSVRRPGPADVEPSAVTALLPAVHGTTAAGTRA
ncbi:MAG: PfkB family carbohydrate kinase [Sporichthyaceae bacterium]